MWNGPIQREVAARTRIARQGGSGHAGFVGDRGDGRRVRVRYAAVILGMTLTAVVATASRGDEPADKDWVGKQVVSDLLANLKKAGSIAYELRGLVRFEKGELDQAIADFTEAIRLDPRNSDAYVNRGAAWMSKHELDKALIDLNEVIRLDPHDSSALWESRQSSGR